MLKKHPRSSNTFRKHKESRKNNNSGKNNAVIQQIMQKNHICNYGLHGTVHIQHDILEGNYNFNYEDNKRFIHFG